MRRRLAITAAAAAATTAAFLIPAAPASADPIVCVEFGRSGADLIGGGGEACLPPAELDFLNLPFPTVYVPIPDFTSLLGNIGLPGFPGFPGLPEQPPTVTPTNEGGTTVVDNTGSTDTTTNSTTPDAKADTSAAAVTPFFDTGGMPTSVADVFNRVNDTLANATAGAAVSPVTTTPNIDITSPINRALGTLGTSLNTALSAVNSVLGGGFNSPNTGLTSTA